MHHSLPLKFLPKNKQYWEILLIPPINKFSKFMTTFRASLKHQALRSSFYSNNRGTSKTDITSTTNWANLIVKDIVSRRKPTVLTLKFSFSTKSDLWIHSRRKQKKRNLYILNKQRLVVNIAVHATLKVRQTTVIRCKILGLFLGCILKEPLKTVFIIDNVERKCIARRRQQVARRDRPWFYFPSLIVHSLQPPIPR